MSRTGTKIADLQKSVLVGASAGSSLIQSQYRAPVFILGPHLDPFGPLLGQPHEQRHAGRHTVQFGVVLAAALALFA